MHFGLTPEQELLQQTLRDFAANELPATRLREIFDGGDGFDADIWEGAAAIGLAGLVVPEAYGGAGMGVVDLALAFEVLGEAAIPGPFFSHALATVAVAEGGDEAQRERWLASLASGEAIGSFALAESNGRWEPDDWTAAVDDEGLTGRKEYVEHGDDAAFFVVGVEGGGLALVDATDPNVRVERVDGVDRTRRLTSVTFDGAAVEPLAGGAALAERVSDIGRTLLAADAYGAAWRGVNLIAGYSLERTQFGTPIGQFQSMKHQMAQIVGELEPMRGLYWYAAYACDALPDERAYSAATAKALITDRSVSMGRKVLELHGGIGFTWEFEGHWYVKRAMFDRLWLGSPRVNRSRVAAHCNGGW